MVGRVLGALAGAALVVLGAVLWRPDLLPHDFGLSLGQLEIYRAPTAALLAVVGVIVAIAASLRKIDQPEAPDPGRFKSAVLDDVNGDFSPGPAPSGGSVAAFPAAAQKHSVETHSTEADPPILEAPPGEAPDVSAPEQPDVQPLFNRPILNLVDDEPPLRLSTDDEPAAPSKIRFDPIVAAPATPAVEVPTTSNVIELERPPVAEPPVAEPPVPEPPVPEAPVLAAVRPAAPEALVSEPVAQIAAPEPSRDTRRPFIVLTEAGDHYRMQGLSDDAMEHYTEALDLARDTHSEMPEDTQAMSDLSAALTNVGDIYDEQGRLDAALQAHQESLVLRRALAARAPDDKAAQRALSLGLERLADTREARGHRTRALDLYRESLPIAERLAAQYPHDALLSKDLATTRQNIAELEAKLI